MKSLRTEIEKYLENWMSDKFGIADGSWVPVADNLMKLVEEWALGCVGGDEFELEPTLQLTESYIDKSIGVIKAHARNNLRRGIRNHIKKSIREEK